MSALLRRALEALRRGEVVAAPTETLVGLLADASSEAAVARVVSLKGRVEGHPMGLLVPSLESLEAICSPLEARARAMAEALWPGPLTLVLGAKPGLPAALTKDGKVAVRWPGESPASRLVSAWGGPLTATSANLTGDEAPRASTDLDSALASRCALVWPGEGQSTVPSTVVDATAWPPRLLRSGALSARCLAPWDVIGG